MPLLGALLAQPRECVEALQERLGEHREVCVLAQVVEAVHVAAGPIERLQRDHALAGETFDVLEELFPVEVRERPPCVWIHPFSARASIQLPK